MTAENKRNYGHSVYQRLLALAKQQNADFTYTLLRFGIERFLYRLSVSSFSDTFVLKGASLFLVWKKHSYRVTKDTDLLGYGPYDEEHLEAVFKEICALQECPEDGVNFLAKSVKATRIREDQEYGGIRITLIGMLHNARIPLQVDIGYGDAVTPSPEVIFYPSSLGLPAAKLRAYSRYTVIAEKFHAMVERGPINSRMKDFYDIRVMSMLFDFEGIILFRAIRDCFRRRGTEIPISTPFALTEAFYRDQQKQTQWGAFLRKAKTEFHGESLEAIVDEIIIFLAPIIECLQKGKEPQLFWPINGPWRIAND